MDKIDSYLIREATEEDAAALREIYAYYVENTSVSFEYQPPTVEEFAGRIAGARKRYPYLLIEHEEEIFGFAFAHAFRERPAYDYAAEATIYLRHDRRRRGFGKLLYTALEEEARRMGIRNLYACVALPTEGDECLSMDSPRFHEALGYRRCGAYTNCGFKFGKWYSVMWMEKLIADHCGQPAPLTAYPELLKNTQSSVPEMLSKYEECEVRLVTAYGELLRGECLAFCAEYGLQEFGVEEEGVQIDSFVIYRSDIRSIEPVPE